MFAMTDVANTGYPQPLPYYWDQMSLCWWSIALLPLGWLHKIRAGHSKWYKDVDLFNHCIKSSSASSPGQCVIAAVYQESRSVWDSATSNLTSCRCATDGPIKLLLHVAQARCPKLLFVWNKTKTGPSWKSKVVKWLVQLERLPPPNSMLWWHFLATSKHLYNIIMAECQLKKFQAEAQKLWSTLI